MFPSLQAAKLKLQYMKDGVEAFTDIRVKASDIGADAVVVVLGFAVDSETEAWPNDIAFFVLSLFFPFYFIFEMWQA